MVKTMLLLDVVAVLLLAACAQTAATPNPGTQATTTPVPGSQTLLDETVMLRMALKYAQSPGLTFWLEGDPTEVRGSNVTTFGEA